MEIAPIKVTETKPGLYLIEMSDGEQMYSKEPLVQGCFYKVEYEVTAKGNKLITSVADLDLNAPPAEALKLDQYFDDWVRACIASDRISIQNIGKDDETWRREVLKHAKWFSENVGKK